jgi:WD40 repeat protein
VCFIHQDIIPMRFAPIWLLVLSTAVRADELPPGAVLRLGNPAFRHNSLLKHVAWSPDGKWLASVGGNDERIKVWETRTGKQVASLLARYHEITMAWSPDSKKIAVGGWSHGGTSGPRLTLWDVESAKVLHHFPVPADDATLVVAFSPDGQLLASGGLTGKVKLWTPGTARLVGSYEEGSLWVKTLAFSPDGKLLAAGGQDKLIRLWDVQKGKLRHTLKDHAGEVFQLCFSPDGKTLASGDSFDTTVRLWNVESGQVRRFWRFGQGYVSSLTWSPDGKRLVASASSNSILHVLDAQTGETLGRLYNSAHSVRGAAYHPDGKTLATAGVEGVVRLWDMTTLKEKPLPPGHQRSVMALAFSADGARLLTGSPDGTARMWDLKTGQEMQRLDWPLHYWISSVAFSRDGLTLAVGGHNETRLFDARTGKLIRTLTGQEGVARFAAFSPDGKTLVTESNGGTLRWWETASCEKRREEPSFSHSIWGLRFRRDGMLLVDGCKSGLVRRYPWDGKEDLVRTAPWMLNTTHLPVLSPDGRMLATIEPGGAIHLWETSTRQLRLRFVTDQKEELHCLAFSPDGRRLACGSADCTTLVWDTMGTKDDVIQQLRENLESCWLKLSSDSSGESYRAIRALASVPEKAVPFLERCLQGTDNKTRAILKLIADLESRQFAVRERATKELFDLGPQVRSHLETALEGKLSLEARRRIEDILDRLPKQALPQLVRDLRALEALERIGTPAAQAVLQRLTAVPPVTPLAREAKAALERLRE